MMIKEGDIVETTENILLRPNDHHLYRGMRGRVIRARRSPLITIEFKEPHGRVTLSPEHIKKVPKFVLKVERAEKERQKGVLRKIVEKGINICT